MSWQRFVEGILELEFDRLRRNVKAASKWQRFFECILENELDRLRRNAEAHARNLANAAIAVCAGRTHAKLVKRSDGELVMEFVPRPLDVAEMQ